MAGEYTPLVQDRRALNEIKYAARDFRSIFDALLRRLKIEYGTIYNEYATTAVAIMLTELMAYANAETQWYVDRTASDCFLATARTDDRVSQLLEQIGYKMRPAAAASASLTLTFPDGTTGPFTMASRWRYQGQAGYQYESYADKVVPAALVPGATITVPVRQGESRLVTYTANGAKNQTYRLTGVTDGRYLGQGLIEVWVDGALWTEYDFLEYEKTNHYEVSYLAAPPIVRFGDGSAGNVPPAGAEVKIRYTIIDGSLGNAKADTITTSLDTLTILGSAVTFTVTNAAGANGGTDPEETDRARLLGPRSFAARGAAITETDYQALSEAFVDPAYGGVSRAFPFNPRGEYEDAAFNGLVEQIEVALDDYRSGASGADTIEAALVTAAESFDAVLSSMGDSVTDLEALRVELEAYLGSTEAALATASSSATQASTRATYAYEQATEAITGADGIDALVAWVGDNIADAAQQAYLEGQLAVVLAEDRCASPFLFR